MKKIIISAGLFLAATAFAGAQNMYDAINFSRNNYFGTARSMALGNAVTALGGDLGSVGINPAGSAVAPYGQFVITPGLTVSAISSSYSPEGERGYGLSNDAIKTRMNLPNIGMSFNFETGNRYGLKAVSMAVLCNQTDNYNFVSEAFGSTSLSSKIAEFANAAGGYEEAILANNGSFDNSDVPWDILTAYQGGMFGTYGDQDGRYVGVSEFLDENGFHYVPGALSQTSYRTKRGSKNDLVMNFGLNFSDRVYVGFNLGLPTARYRYSESFAEGAVEPSRFPLVLYKRGVPYDTEFQRGNYNYQYLADMGGIYAKVGIIVRPVKGLRLGASFQTPTVGTISETWQYSAATTFSNSDFNDSAVSPQGEYSYNLRSPYLASFGAAFTFGKSGFISADYELADYSVMRFSPVHDRRLAGDAFLQQNWTNKYFAGVSHSLRIGAEVRVTPELSFRAGYSMTTTPERWWTNSKGERVTADDFGRNFYDYFNRVEFLVTPHYYEDRTRTFSAGIGYSSPGSFFMDAVVRLTRYPVETFAPYYDYDSFDSHGNEQFVESPRILTNRDLWSAALTLGWRF